MQIENILNQAQSTAAISNLAAAFGVDPEKAGIAAEFMLQQLSDRIERNSLSRGGVADIVDLLGRPQAGRAFNDPESLGSPQMTQIGNYVLDVLFGSKHQSRGIAGQAARLSGINADTAERMWPAVASLMIGALQSKTQNDFDKNFSGYAARSPLPLPGEGPIGQTETSNDDWNVELPKPAGGAGGGMGGTVGRSPLPIPGDDIPGIDRDSRPSRFPDLPDIVRRGGTPSPDGGGMSLEELIRSILANALGFKNGGILSWIVNLLLSKWFLGFAMRIIRRILLGR